MYFSLFLCKNGIHGKETIFVVLLELKSLFVKYENTSFIYKWLYLLCEQLGSMVIKV